jgi:hypothetical protein
MERAQKSHRENRQGGIMKRSTIVRQILILPEPKMSRSHKN